MRFSRGYGSRQIVEITQHLLFLIDVPLNPPFSSFFIPMNASDSAGICAALSLVFTLVFWGGPAAIRWFVVAVIIAPFDPHFAIRTPSHIGEEGRECAPSLANCYAPSAVSRKILIFGIQAALTHRLPHLVFWHFGKPVVNAFSHDADPIFRFFCSSMFSAATPCASDKLPT